MFELFNLFLKKSFLRVQTTVLMPSVRNCKVNSPLHYNFKSSHAQATSWNSWSEFSHVVCALGGSPGCRSSCAWTQRTRWLGKSRWAGRGCWTPCCRFCCWNRWQVGTTPGHFACCRVCTRRPGLQSLAPPHQTWQDQATREKNLESCIAMFLRKPGVNSHSDKAVHN